MEKKLKMLFDYQRFEKNAKLEKLISETQDSFAKELSDDELLFVNAAGEPDLAGGTISNNQSEGDGGGVFVDGPLF